MEEKKLMLEITKEDAEGALNALNRLQVTGIKNCEYVAFIASVLSSGKIAGGKGEE